MEWHLTMLAVHVLALGALVALLRGGPDPLQSLVVGLLCVSTAALVYYYLAALAGWPVHWQVKSIAYSVEHIGVLLYIARLFIADQERRCLPTPSARLNSSRR